MEIKKYTTSMKEFLKRNRNTIIACTVLGTVVVIQQKGIRQLGGFLHEKGLYNEYFFPDWDE